MEEPDDVFRRGEYERVQDTNMSVKSEVIQFQSPCQGYESYQKKGPGEWYLVGLSVGEGSGSKTNLGVASIVDAVEALKESEAICTGSKFGS